MLASTDKSAYREISIPGDEHMQRRLDYTAVWNDAIALLKAHKEAVIAIVGLLVFLPGWINSYAVGEPDLAGLKTVPALIAAFEAHFNANWFLIIPLTLATMFGGFVVYVLMIRNELPRVGDALMTGLKLFIPYFVISLLTGFVTMLGFIAFILPGFYLSARFISLPSVVASGDYPGITAPIKRAWELTRGVGWATFFLTLIVVIIGSISVMVAGLVFGLFLKIFGSGDVVRLIETGFNSLLAAGLSAVLIALAVAIYRHLKAQDV
jgi:uncharacterized membrane protein